MIGPPDGVRPLPPPPAPRFARLADSPRLRSGTPRPVGGRHRRHRRLPATAAVSTPASPVCTAPTAATNMVFAESENLRVSSCPSAASRAGGCRSGQLFGDDTAQPDPAASRKQSASPRGGVDARRPFLPGRPPPGGRCADFSNFARFPAKTMRRRPDRLTTSQLHPFRCRRTTERTAAPVASPAHVRKSTRALGASGPTAVELSLPKHLASAFPQPGTSPVIPWW